MTDQVQLAELAVSLIDLTSLTNKETGQDIINLCQQAVTPMGNTAAICIYPRYIPIAKQALKTLNADTVKIATVTNFPHGDTDINQAVQETAEAVALGADEVDVVFPYKALMQGDTQIGYDLVQACKRACSSQVLLKVIIESGELKTESLITQASEIAIAAGANFIKTSTGKVPVNATIEAANTMLNVINKTNSNIGFKAAGGVRTIEDVELYLSSVMDTLGSSWLNPTHFRFGASGLLNNLLACQSGNITNNNDTSKDY